MYFAMLVPTMNDLEIFEEIKKDLPQLHAYMSFLNTGRKYRKYLQGRKPKGDRFIFVIEDWKSRRNNHYTFIFYTKSLRDMLNHGFANYILTFLNKGNKLSAYRLVRVGDEMNLEVCTSHFIDRYNQRFLKNPDLSRKQAFIEFYKRNNTCNVISMPSDVHEYNYIATYNDGHCFMKRENDYINVMRTFISRDMLFSSQYDMADMADESLNNYYKGVVSNMSYIENELENVCNGEQKIPTMDDYNHCLEMIHQLHEKKESLQQIGKQFDLEYSEMRNNLTLWIAGFDWLAAMLKDDKGQLVQHPLFLYD